MQEQNNYSSKQLQLKYQRKEKSKRKLWMGGIERGPGENGAIYWT